VRAGKIAEVDRLRQRLSFERFAQEFSAQLRRLGLITDAG
jgi:hypothetical protein